MNRFTFAAFAALMVGCAGDTKSDSGGTYTDGGGDTGACDTTYSGPVTITTASASCASNTATIEVETEGWTADGRIYQTDNADNPPYHDEHDLTSYEFDQCGAWDHLRTTLATDTAYADLEENVNTLFSCANHYNSPGAVMSYAAMVYDLSGNEADCLAWGVDPNAVVADSSGDGPSWDESICVVGARAN